MTPAVELNIRPPPPAFLQDTPLSPKTLGKPPNRHKAPPDSYDPLMLFNGMNDICLVLQGPLLAFAELVPITGIEATASEAQCSM